MKKEDNAEGKFAHHRKNSNQEAHCKLLKQQQKNGILPWKSTEKKMLHLYTNEAEQQSLEAGNENLSLISCQELSKPLLLLSEDNAEDFHTELILFNDLWNTSEPVSCELVSCNEYLPYYRTYANLLETPLYINTRGKHNDTEREEGIQSNGCVFKSKDEDEAFNDVSLVTGYVLYYRSDEEYFGSPDLPSEARSRLENEEAEIESTEEIETEIDCGVEEVFEHTVVPEECSTDEYISQSTEDLTETDQLTDCTINPCASEISLLDEILSLNQPSSSSYFPYYRTYGQLLLSPVDLSNTIL